MSLRYLKDPYANALANQLSTTDISLISHTVTISNTKPTTSTVSGALVVAGGVGIGQNLRVGGDIFLGNLLADYGFFDFDLTLGGTLYSQNIQTIGTISSFTGNFNTVNVDNVNINQGSFENVEVVDRVIANSFVLNSAVTTDLTTSNLTATDISTSTLETTYLRVDFVEPRFGSQVMFGDNTKVRITGGSNGQILGTDGNGNLTWVDNFNVLNFGAGLDKSGYNIQLANSGVTPGVYNRVTVDNFGRVTLGELVNESLSVITSRGATTPDAITITNSTDTSAINQGALIVSGGVGIGKTLVAGDLIIKNTSLFEGLTTFQNDVTLNDTLILNGRNNGNVPLTIASGALLPSTSIGNLEFDGDYLYITTNAGRKRLTVQETTAALQNVFIVRAVAEQNIDINDPQQYVNDEDQWDDVVLAQNDRVLLAAQDTASENGIYVWNTAGTALVRALDFNTLTGVRNGSLIVVTEGTRNYYSTWQIKTSDPIAVGASDIAIEQVGNADSVSISQLPKNTTSGLVARTTYGTTALRSVVSNSTWVTIANGDAKNGNITISTGVVPVTSGGTGRTSWIGYLRGTGTALTSSTTIPVGNIAGIGTIAIQNANAITITGGNITVTTANIDTVFSNTVNNSGTVTTNNLTVNSSATISNLTVTDALLGNVTIGSNVQIPNLFGNVIKLGANTAGQLSSRAVTLNTQSNVTDSIALMNLILGKLVPPAPPEFPNSQTISIQSASSYKMCDFVQTDNTSDQNASVAGGTTVTTVRRSSSYQTNDITGVGPGDTGTLSVTKNGTLAGNLAMAAQTNGTYGDLVVFNNQDYNNLVSTVNPNFWYSFSCRAAGTATAGWNDVVISHTAADTTNKALWYYDNSSPGTPQFVNPLMTMASSQLVYSSSIPHYTSATQFDITFDVNRLSGDTYPTSDTFITGTAGGAFAAPESKTYAQAGITTPLARNLYVAGGSKSILTKANIRTGFGTSSLGPSISVVNGYATGTQDFAPLATILYKTGTGNQIEETSIPVTSVGSGSGNAARIVIANSSDTPAYTGSESLFNSELGTIGSADAVVVGSVLKHDQTNYGVGHLPIGPNLSVGRAGAQYFTLKFARSVVSKFNIKYSGTIAGLWVALPGSTIDSTSTLNGWLTMGSAYNGAGVPGAGAGGNGSNGCALGGLAVFNSAQTNRSVTATFGTVSSSSTVDNVIYVRIKLTAGQSLTALSIEAATN